MRAILTVDMDGAGFALNDGADELCSILRNLAERVSEYGPRRAFGRVSDSKGNHVGELRIEDGSAQPTAEPAHTLAEVKAFQRRETQKRKAAKALLAAESATPATIAQHTYSLDDIRHGTGFPDGVRFVVAGAQPTPQPADDYVNEDYHWINEDAGTYRCTAACGFQFDDGRPEDHRCRYGIDPGPKDAEPADVNADLSELVKAVLLWASTPGDHGGNPYLKPFVMLARKIAGDE